MNAIRQIVEVKDHKLQIQLPENFEAEFVEVIIFPKEDDLAYEISEEEKDLISERVKNSNPEGFKNWRDIRNKYI
jgi:hypothetical protein